MEVISGNIEPCTVPLSAQDALLMFTNHPLVHFYENADGHSEFMPTDVLRDALYLALRELPLLFGHIKDTNDGNAAIVVDKSNLNEPDFQESASTVHYRAIKNARYNWDIWPQSVATAGPATAPGTDGTVKLVNVHVVRLAENSGVILFCNIPHYVVDGVGYYEFLAHWAALCRCRCRASHAEQLEGITFNFDRRRLAASLQGPRRPLDPITRDILLNRSVISRLLTCLSFATRTRLVAMTMGFNYGQGHFFRVSGAALDELQRMVKRTQGEQELSSYSLLAALFRMAVSQAQMQPREPAGMVARTMAAATSVIARLLSNPDAPHMLLNIVHTYRLLPPTANTYIGNNIYLCPVNICTKQLQHCTDAETFGRIAMQIAQAVEGIDRPLLGEFYDTVCTHPHAYANFSSFMSAQPTALSVIDERHYRTSSADFGDGGPAWISGLPRHMPNFVAIFASSASAGGADIYVSLKEPVVKAMLKNPFFTAHAELLF